MTTTYRDGRIAKLKDTVVGRNKNGQPVAGTVIAMNASGEVHVSPALHNPVWVDATACGHVENVFAGPEPKATKETAPQSEPQTGTGSDTTSDTPKSGVAG